MSITPAGNAKEIFIKSGLFALFIAVSFPRAFTLAQAQAPESIYTKITTNEICVTDKVAAGTLANEEARRLADEATTKSCLKPKD
jgi:hypothetical protein